MGLYETITKMAAEMRQYGRCAVHPALPYRAEQRLRDMAEHYGATPDDMAATILCLFLDRDPDDQLYLVNGKTYETRFTTVLAGPSVEP